ncbi:MAG: hypothetical protein OSA99_13030 [Acidimicrobiales bacterium]|nr:hypothetical protein [Acidimicrobiales bacterium]
MGKTDIFDNGGSVSADCHGRSAGRPPGTPGGVSEADLYASYCGDIPGELASYDIGPSPNEVTIESVSERGLDPSGVYVFYRLVCFGDDGGILFSIDLLYEVTPPVDPTVLRDRALAQLVLPDPSVGTFPPLENPALVQTATWMWVEDNWAPLAAADGQGFTAVTVTATPSRADWSMGDGAVVPCAGPGERWEPGRYDSGSSCTHTYTRSSAGRPDGRYSASVTVVWDLTWSINGNAQGSFGQVDQTSAFSIAVGEVQAAESNGGEAP